MNADTLPATEDATRTEPPPKAWRNRWHSSVGWDACSHCGGDHTIEGTDQWWGCLVHPTKAAAEDNAANQLAARAHEPLTAHVTYLGAFPIPVSP